MPKRKNTAKLNQFLQDDVTRYIKLNRNEFQHYYSVCNRLFNRLHTTMKDVDPYYMKYSSTTVYTGSHADKLRITTPDEFDINFIVNLPLNMDVDRQQPNQSDIIIEPQDPGYVELLMGDQFENLPKRDDWLINKTAYDWGDEEGYLLSSKFKDWFKKVVAKALNKFSHIGNYPSFKHNRRTYLVKRTEAGPSLQLIVEDASQDFKMDIDLVPALRFPTRRWPISRDYRPLPPPRKRGENYWIVVPKPNKSDPDDEETISRSWRIGLQNQESQLIFHRLLLKPTIRLLKKFRDAQSMDKVASYYIKNLFYLQMDSPDSFWRGPPYILFKTMLLRLYDALDSGYLAFYWNDNLNLIENVDRSILDGYCNKLRSLLVALDQFDILSVAEIMLTDDEFDDYVKTH